ncbi:MAG: cobalamin B12-binding domain-containing protein [Eubacteriaceae bacterium]
MTSVTKALVDLEEDLVLDLIDEQISKGVSLLDIMNECNDGMIEVGELFASGEYYLTELMFSAEILQSVMKKLEPLMSENNYKVSSKETIVIGTVAGDIHNIGKNIVISLLKSYGFNVIDLGIDVPAEKFVKSVKETGTKILGLSALLNNTYPEMKNVIDTLSEAGLRDQVKIIIGGTITSESVREFTGADAFANDAMTGINYIKSILEEEAVE